MRRLLGAAVCIHGFSRGSGEGVVAGLLDIRTSCQCDAIEGVVMARDRTDEASISDESVRPGAARAEDQRARWADAG